MTLESPYLRQGARKRQEYVPVGWTAAFTAQTVFHARRRYLFLTIG
jgi:hypothetical protein